MFILMSLPVAPWKVAFAVINKPSWVKIALAKVCPACSELLSTKAKKRCTSCFTSDESWNEGHIAEVVELSIAYFRIMK